MHANRTYCLLRRTQAPKSVKSNPKQAEHVRPVSTDATASYSQGVTVNKDFGYIPQEQTSIERYFSSVRQLCCNTGPSCWFSMLPCVCLNICAILLDAECDLCRPEMSRATTPFRKTKIVCTIGPTSCSREDLFRLADQGMNVARSALLLYMLPISLSCLFKTVCRMRTCTLIAKALLLQLKPIAHAQN